MMKLTKKVLIIIAMILVTGFMGAFESHPAQASKLSSLLFGSSKVELTVFAQTNIVLGYDPSRPDYIIGVIRVGTGGMHSGDAFISINNNPLESIAVYRLKNDTGDGMIYERYGFAIPISRLNKSLPNIINTTVQMWRPEKHHPEKRDKLVANSTGTASFAIYPVEVEETDEQVKQQYEQKSDSSSGQDSSATTQATSKIDATQLANFFDNSSSSSTASASASASASATTSAASNGIQSSTVSASASSGAKAEVSFGPKSPGLTLQIQAKPGKEVYVLAYDRNGQVIFKDGKSSGDRNGRAVPANGVLSYSGIPDGTKVQVWLGLAAYSKENGTDVQASINAYFPAGCVESKYVDARSY